MDSEQSLNQALQAWKIRDSLPARFEEQVWLRVGRAEARSAGFGWKRFSSWLVEGLARPSLAVSYVTVLLLAGLLAGYWQAHMEKSRTIESLSSRYVHMLDPYQGRH